MPVPILIEDPAVNAFAYFRTSSKEIPFLFIIHTGALKASEEQQQGLYAHELGHLVTKNVNPEVAKSLAKYYFVNGIQEPLGLLQNNNPGVESYVKRYLSLAGSIGPLARRSLNGQVVDLFGNADYGLLENYLINQYMMPRRNADVNCQKGSDLKQAAFVLLTKGLNVTAFTLNLDAKDTSTLSDITKQFNDALDACIGSEKPDLLKLFVAMSGKPLEDFQKKVPAEDITTFNSATSIWKGFLAITIPREAEYEDIAKKHDLSRTRLYTFEENADEAAARALKAMGRSSQDLASFFYMTMSAQDIERCRAQIAAGQVPAYGPLFDPHHSTCYRIYHLGTYEKYLQQ